jgi:TorA maturation chaperone TorD
MTLHRQAEIDQALERAVAYRVLSLGFQMPTEERLQQMGACDRLSDVGTLATTFVRLFGHTTRGQICACETEYGADNAYHQPQQLADIAGYYLAFGLQAVPASDVRADHVACECEFMDFMNRKEAFFLGTGTDEETLDVTRRASRAFLRDHLGRFGRAFATRVMVEDPQGFFGNLARILFELLEAECRRLGLTSGPVDLSVRPDVPDPTPMACGTPAELIQIQR